MHDVTLTLYTRPDCLPCDVFAPIVRAAVRDACCRGSRTVSMTTWPAADDPQQPAPADVTVFPTLLARVDGIPVARLEGLTDLGTVQAFLDSVELADVI